MTAQLLFSKGEDEQIEQARTSLIYYTPELSLAQPVWNLYYLQYLVCIFLLFSVFVLNNRLPAPAPYSLLYVLT